MSSFQSEPARSLTDMDLKEKIRAEALRLGFFLCGFARPQQPPHFPIFRRWLSAGRQAKMAYLENERAVLRRSDPRQIQTDCRTVVVLALPYAPPQPAVGRVAAYAQAADYHDIIPPRLEQLSAFISEIAGKPVQALAYTDTGAILERDFAQLAGLGWIGKNTLLINPQVGSYFLLAELLLDLEIEPDQPFTADRCGTCTRCQVACPTNCILPDRTIDAGRCISYLTIENKGAIPRELRPLIGDWVFGCDICQIACPWNRHAPASGEPALSGARSSPPGWLRAELHLTPSEFKQKYQGSPILRAKRRGFLRNIAVALGNLRDQAAIPDLAHALRDEEPLVRAHAAWALGEMDSPDAKKALQHAWIGETEIEVREEIRLALLNYGSQTG